MKKQQFLITMLSSILVTGLIVALVGCGVSVSPFSAEEIMMSESEVSSWNNIHDGRCDFNTKGDDKDDWSGAIIQGFHWNLVKTQGNGTLGNGYDASRTWYDLLKDTVPEIADIGFTAIWMPPPWKDDSKWWGDGGYPMGGGEGYFWHDFSRSESYAINNSRYGTYNDLEEVSDRLHDYDITILYDMVPNHRDKHRQTYKTFWDFSEKSTDDNKDSFVSGDCDVNTYTHFGRYQAAMNELKTYYHADGFRWDFVRGYDSGRVDAWMDAVFGNDNGVSVGELWKDPISNYQLAAWSDGADSAVFDFALKKNFNASSFGGLCTDSDANLRERAVTFIDNHDTGASPDCGANDWGQRHWQIPSSHKKKALAYISVMPGTPCYYWPDIFDWGNKKMVSYLLAARKAAGVMPRSSISWQSGSGSVGAIVNDKLAISINHTFSKAGDPDWDEIWEEDGQFTVWLKKDQTMDWTDAYVEQDGTYTAMASTGANQWEVTITANSSDADIKIDQNTSSGGEYGYTGTSPDPITSGTSYSMTNSGWDELELEENHEYRIVFNDSTKVLVAYDLGSADPTTTTTTTTVDGVTYYKIKNRWKGTYMVADAARIGYGTGSGDAYLWEKEAVDSTYFRLKNKATGSYMHFEDAPGDMTQHGEVESSWHSAQWKEVSTDGYVRLKIRWGDHDYKELNVEDQKGYVELSDEPSNHWSTHWTIEQQ
jgi:hypothetical protein